MNDEAQIPEPSPEVAQLVLLGQLDDAVALFAKQAEIDPDTARAKLAELDG
jgi:hypothetical protein